jgi:hypothetical protein
MLLKTNAGTMLVRHKATIPGYKKKVWFSTRAITNIVALSNLIQQYRITFDGNGLMFVVHREPDKPNLELTALLWSAHAEERMNVVDQHSRREQDKLL